MSEENLLKLFLIFCLFIFASCSTIKLSEIPGDYEGKTKDSITRISFMENGRFSFSQQNGEVTRSCEGNWKLESKNTIIILCEDKSETIFALSSSYMEPIPRTAVFLSKDKIKIERAKLTKVKK